MFVTGPKVVRAVTSEDVDTETLGGGRVHAERSGVAHFLVASELEGLELARRLLSYFPANNCEAPPAADSADPITRRCERLAHIVPAQANRPYDTREVIAQVVDADSFLEVSAHFAGNVVVGLARMDGQPVGIVANNPAVLAGVLDIDASRKAARFVRTCNAFGLPLISLVDVPGFLPGQKQEHAGIISHGAKLAYAYCEATVPKLTVILRKAYGGALHRDEQQARWRRHELRLATGRNRGDGRRRRCRDPLRPRAARTTTIPPPAAASWWTPTTPNSPTPASLRRAATWTRSSSPRTPARPSAAPCARSPTNARTCPSAATATCRCRKATEMARV